MMIHLNKYYYKNFNRKYAGVFFGSNSVTGFAKIVKHFSYSLIKMNIGASVILKRNKSTNSKDTACRDLVLWGECLGSMVGSGRLTKIERNMIKLAPIQHSVIVGVLLSDGWLEQYSSSSNIRFKQSAFQIQYVIFVWLKLLPYLNSLPYLGKGYRKGKWHTYLQITTRSLVCFTEIYYLFIFFFLIKK